MPSMARFCAQRFRPPPPTSFKLSPTTARDRFFPAVPAALPTYL
eukprot:CAMPEP_0194774972 /NCGR_PEP_ID=MMETSP0323_2-20130528/59112_1 /TAXON_ID=2866 ORGANISM="Crypthecodinium cohnii, Strain Seligo" /NCGR_SAMPLE_ID=MMETSP0323_2 /ASSEMBLY_ACC=CAM_ASM_000346 /LENGTH=43 /DNA_ID= /DNA_START= /DNA_END= /DNA_ORIENTATION=